MVTISYIERKDSGQISLLNESIDTICENEYELPLIGSENQNLLSSKELKKGTIDNLLGIGILLPIEIDHYRELLDTYDYGTLIRVYIYSEELKDSQY